MQWQIWKKNILLAICKTKCNVIIFQNIYSNPLNAFLGVRLLHKLFTQELNLYDCSIPRTVLNSNTYTLSSWDCMNDSADCRQSKVSGPRRTREGLYILWLKTFTRRLPKACVQQLRWSWLPSPHTPNIMSVCLSLAICPLVAAFFCVCVGAPPLIWLVKLNCLWSCFLLLLFFLSTPWVHFQKVTSLIKIHRMATNLDKAGVQCWKIVHCGSREFWDSLLKVEKKNPEVRAVIFVWQSR